MYDLGIYKVFDVYSYYVIERKKEMMKNQDLVGIGCMVYDERDKNVQKFDYLCMMLPICSNIKCLNIWYLVGIYFIVCQVAKWRQWKDIKFMCYWLVIM